MLESSIRVGTIRAAGAALAIAAGVAAPPASAIPAFARKYETSCLTCHVVFPKLTPFGEAFRRNGYRFPGVDSDYVKQPTVALGQEKNKKTFPRTAWPAAIPSSVPLSVGVNGQADIVPSKTSSAGRQDAAGRPFSGITVQDLVAEGHLWAGAALDDAATLWGELTFVSDGSVEVEHFQLLLEDLLGPKHAINLVAGHGFPTVTPFGPHSSYVADLMLPNLPVTGIYGTSTDPWVIVDSYTGLELNGVVAGRLGYSLGVNADRVPSGVRFRSESGYAHAGWKFGGMRLDGEGSSGPPNALRPWAETSITPYAFAYHSKAWWTVSTEPPAYQDDVANTFGAGLRAQLGSLELDAGHYRSHHNHGTDVLGTVVANVTFGELSYVVFPWLVPSIRLERAGLRPAGGPTAGDWHVMPGVAFLVRPNVRILAVANWEHASGFPTTTAGPVAWDGGAAGWGPLVSAPPPSGATSVSELESFAIFVQWAI